MRVRAENETGKFGQIPSLLTSESAHFGHVRHSGLGAPGFPTPPERLLRRAYFGKRGAAWKSPNPPGIARIADRCAVRREAIRARMANRF